MYMVIYFILYLSLIAERKTMEKTSDDGISV